VKVVGVDLDDRKVDFELTTAPMNAGQSGARSQSLDMPKPARLPRKRTAGDKKGMTKEELLNPGKKKTGAGKSSTAKTAKADSKKTSKKKPSKRQKLNAKKSAGASAKGSSARGSSAKSSAKSNTKKNPRKKK
jgi:ribonuclease R